jgi:hypothetical protein
MGDVRLEVTLSYILTVVVLLNFVAGIFSVDYLNPTLAYLQMGLLLFALGQFAYLTLQLEQQQHNRSPFLPPRKLNSSSSSSSFSERQKLQVATIAAASQFVSGLLRVLDMTFADGRNGYLGDMSRYGRCLGMLLPVYEWFCSFHLLFSVAHESILLLCIYRKSHL